MPYPKRSTASAGHSSDHHTPPRAFALRRGSILTVSALCCVLTLGSTPQAWGAQPSKATSAQSAPLTVTGTVIDNQFGNRNGVVTIQTANGNIDLFYDVAGGFALARGDTVQARYQPAQADYSGVLLSVKVLGSK
jgi:hypothetical protein